MIEYNITSITGNKPELVQRIQSQKDILNKIKQTQSKLENQIQNIHFKNTPLPNQLYRNFCWAVDKHNEMFLIINIM